MNGITIGELYAGWIGNLGESARSNYSSNIKEFFQLMYNKSVDEVTEEDLASIRPHNVQTNYINVLMDSCKNSTIKYKIKNVQQFINRLNINRVYQNVNYAFINDVALSTTNLRDDSSRTRKIYLKHILEYASSSELQFLKSNICEDKEKNKNTHLPKNRTEQIQDLLMYAPETFLDKLEETLKSYKDLTMKFLKN